MIHRRLTAAATSIVLALVVAGCDGGLFGPQSGNVRFVLSSATVAPMLTDAPAAAPSMSVVDGAALSGGHDDDDDDHPNPYFQSANVTFTSVLARNLDGVLVNITMDLPVTVDVMTMERGRQITLPDGDLAPGTYDQVVVVMSQVQGVTHEGTTITIDPPGGGWTAIGVRIERSAAVVDTIEAQTQAPAKAFLVQIETENAVEAGRCQVQASPVYVNFVAVLEVRVAPGGDQFELR